MQFPMSDPPYQWSKRTQYEIRSTVGTMTELCDYFKVWFPQIAELTDPSSGETISFETTTSQAKKLLQQRPKEMIYIGFLFTKPSAIAAESFLSYLKNRICPNFDRRRLYQN